MEHRPAGPLRGDQARRAQRRRVRGGGGLADAQPPGEAPGGVLLGEGEQGFEPGAADDPGERVRRPGAPCGAGGGPEPAG
ncbi:hypothetical protein GCM10010273_02270 [Streptomyces lavendulocolor]